MIPREILKKIRQIELRTNRLVTESLAGQYHSVFKGQGMNFEEVREYQPGDEVRSIDWNVTARMNHPFVKKFVEERELTLLLLVDLSASGWFGSGEQSKRELAAEIASVLAFSAIRNNDKVGLILFTDEIEKYMPPRKGRRYVLRVIREILFFEPRRRGTNLPGALDFLNRVAHHKAIAVVISDFQDHRIGEGTPTRLANAGMTSREAEGKRPKAEPKPTAGAPGPGTENLEPIRTPGPAEAGTSRGRAATPPRGAGPLGAMQTSLRRANRRHDVVAVQITDRFEEELPALGRLVLRDAETDQVIEINTADLMRRRFAQQRSDAQAELTRAFRTLGIDSIQLRTDRPYAAALGRFFEAREKRRLRG